MLPAVFTSNISMRDLHVLSGRHQLHRTAPDVLVLELIGTLVLIGRRTHPLCGRFKWRLSSLFIASKTSMSGRSYSRLTHHHKSAVGDCCAELTIATGFM